MSREYSGKLVDIGVFVDENRSGQFVLWEKSVQFRNTTGKSQVYDEFYSHTDQSGIRFGNGIYGKIPATNARIRVDVKLTLGNSELMPDQRLYPAGDNIDFTGLTLTTSETIGGGFPGESQEEIRGNAKYYALYDESIVWNDDYRFFILRQHPGVIWCKIWGEQEQEAMEGMSLGQH